MSCRITGKICSAWSEVAGCGLVRCKFMEKKDGGEILNDETVTDRHQMTNADRIRAMTDEEMVVFLDGFSGRCLDCAEDAKNRSCPIYKEGHYCRPKDIMEWLQQPAEEDDHA